MAEIVNNLTKRVAAVLFVSSHLRHHKIALTKRCTLGIDTDKDVGYDIDVKGIGQLDDAHLYILD